MSETPARSGDELLHEKGMAFTRVGTAAGSAQRLSRAYLDAMQIEMRVVDTGPASARTVLFGRKLETPILVTALSALDRIRPDGAVAVARGAHAAGAAMMAGIGSEDELQRIIDTGVATIKIIKPYRDNDLVFRKIEHANKCGVCAVGMDISYAFGMHKGYTPAAMAAKSADELRQFAAAASVPFIWKGVLSPSDAEKAVQAGCGGIMVSHQGGTVLDYAVPPLRVLPAIASVNYRRLPVLVDGTIHTGIDAFKALALGAHAVGVGWAIASALAAGGSEAVETLLRSMTAQLERTMSLTGAVTPDTIDPAVLWPPGRSPLYP